MLTFDKCLGVLAVIAVPWILLAIAAAWPLVLIGVLLGRRDI